MKILIFHATAGFGHKKVAEVIAEAFRQKGGSQPEIHCRDSLDFTPSVFKTAYKEIYYQSVKWTPAIWGASYEFLDKKIPYAVLKPFRELGNSLVGRKLMQFVREQNPDTIISTHFFTAEFFARAKRGGHLNAELITVVTDFYPHTFWVNDGTDLYWVMSEEGRKDLERRGVPADRIMTGGIPVGSAFRPNEKKSEFRVKYQLDADKFTLLISGGSFGLGDQSEILRHLDQEFGDSIQCLVVCGHNQKLFEGLSGLQLRMQTKIFGFVDTMHELMSASDVIVAKPGGSTTSECLSLGLPMIIMHAIPGQESRNLELLRQRKAALYLEKSEKIVEVIKELRKDASKITSLKEAIFQLRKPNAADDLVSYVLSQAGRKGD